MKVLSFQGHGVDQMCMKASSTEWIMEWPWNEFSSILPPSSIAFFNSAKLAIEVRSLRNKWKHGENDREHTLKGIDFR